MSMNLTIPNISLDRLLGNALDGIFVIDRRRRYVVFNEVCERITGHKAPDIIGRECRCADVVSCSDDYGRPLSGILCPARTLLDGTLESARQRMQIHRKDGTPTWIETIYTAVRDGEGQVEFVLGIVRDVSEAKAREDELRAEMSQLRERVRSLCVSQENGEPSDCETCGPDHPAPQARLEHAPEAGASLSLNPYLQRVEREVILRALDTAGGQRSRAAQLLGISRSRLYRRMEALKIGPGHRRE
jgi:PAS domain S-box-containing protein